MSEPVSMSRIIELVSDLSEPHTELGPLDRQDLQTLLCEVLERRNQDIGQIPNGTDAGHAAASASAEPK